MGWDDKLRSVIYTHNETGEVKFSATGETTTGAVRAAVSITVAAQGKAVLENVERNKKKGIVEGHALYGKERPRRRSVADADGNLTSFGMEGPKLVKGTLPQANSREASIAGAAKGLGVAEHEDSDDDMYAAPTLAGIVNPT